MPTITEAEAQQLANMLKRWLAVDRNGDVFFYPSKPCVGYIGWCTTYEQWHLLPIRIASDRPWTEQIWGPEPSTPPAPSENV